MTEQLVDDADFQWTQDHWPELCKEYPGQWIAVLDQRVIGHAHKLMGLRGLLPDTDYYVDYIHEDCADE